MKKTLIFTAAIALAAGTITSCKKGANDPFLSFKSRKGRLAGDWTVSQMSSTNTSKGQNGVTKTTTNTFDGSKMTKNVSYSDNTPSSSQVYTYTDFSFTFNKDNTYKQSIAYTYTTVDTLFWQDANNNSIQTTVHTVTSSSEGNWSFIGKQKGDFKNKERFSTLETSYTSSDQSDVTTVTTSFGTSATSTSTSTDNNASTDNQPSFANVMILDQLKSKEIVITSDDASTNNSNTVDQGGTTINYDNTYTYTSSYTLSAK